MAKETNQDNAQDDTQTENGNNTNAGRIGTSITPEGEMTANVLLEALGTTIEPDLLVEALTHRSFSHEHEGVMEVPMRPALVLLPFSVWVLSCALS